MEIIEVDNLEYSKIFEQTYHIFNTSQFNFLNQNKCESVKYLLFKQNKYKLGLIAGIKNKQLFSPFSSPFGGFSFLKSDIQIATIENAILELDKYCIINNLNGIEFILPPTFYNEIFLSKLINVLYRNNYMISNLDLDFYFKTENFENNYSENIWHNARKNLNQALKKNLDFKLCFNDEDKNTVYEIIKQNRLFKNKPLNMSFEQITETSKIIKTDFFLVNNQDISIASAIVYYVAPEIVYIPFWADKQGFHEFRPMNFLAYKIFEYYSSKKIKIVHIGISTEKSIPNYGLCEFKESIGCCLAPKYSFSKIIV